MSLMSKFRLNPVLFFLGQPGGICRPISQVGEQQKAEDHSGCGFDKEHPFPPGKAESAIEPQKRGRDWSAKCNRDWRRDGKPGNHAPAMARREPIMEIEKNPWEKSGLGRSQ